jgi:DNA-directed RNA polymerase subunit RPC12/RpoP
MSMTMATRCTRCGGTLYRQPEYETRTWLVKCLACGHEQGFTPTSERPAERHALVATIELVCQHCGARFLRRTKNKGQRYCSQACGSAAGRHPREGVSR